MNEKETKPGRIIPTSWLEWSSKPATALTQWLMPCQFTAISCKRDSLQENAFHKDYRWHFLQYTSKACQHACLSFQEASKHGMARMNGMNKLLTWFAWCVYVPRPGLGRHVVTHLCNPSLAPCVVFYHILREQGDDAQRVRLSRLFEQPSGCHDCLQPHQCTTSHKWLPVLGALGEQGLQLQTKEEGLETLQPLVQPLVNTGLFI